MKMTTMPTPDQVLPGREQAMPVDKFHFVNGNPMLEPYPAGMQQAMFGMGCFWGVERRFWQTQGVYLTAAGYAGGFTPNPDYREVCSGMTGHNEVVRVIYDPQQVSYQSLLKLFWESHDPTQGMRQGNDIGTQYRSGIYTFSPQQKQIALESQQLYQQALLAAGKGMITTEVISAPVFYFAEDYHQQYLAKNPDGYCGMAGTGVAFHFADTR